MNLNWKVIGGGVAIVVIFAVAVWALFFRHTATPAPNQTGTFGVGSDNTRVNVPAATNTNTQTPATNSSSAKIFKISDGPIAGATLIQTQNPTTTVARYVLAENGHVQDLPIDSPGAVARAVSNTTVPGIMRTLWGAQPAAAKGSAVIMQYLSGETVKTLSAALPVGTSTAVHMQFLPDGIASVALSPDGKSVAYVLRTAAGSDIYTADYNGGNSKKILSMPLSQLLVSWPSAKTLLLSTPAAADTPGMVFSVGVTSGAATPLLSANGLTAIGDSAFSRVLYQTAGSGGRTTYSHDIKTGSDTPLSFEPLPEQCIWSQLATSTAVCAAPLSYVPGNFVDLWHAGTFSVAEGILAFGPTNKSAVIATPGSADGGVQSDIAEMALSPDEHYLLFIKKGDRSLWGVRLVQ